MEDTGLTKGVESVTKESLDSSKDSGSKKPDLYSEMKSMFQEFKTGMDDIRKEINQIKSREFTRDEIKEMAHKNIIEAQVKREEEKLEHQITFKDQLENGKNALDIRNAMGDHELNNFLEERITRSEIQNALYFAETKRDEEIRDLFCLCMFRALAPRNGLSIEDLNKVSLISTAKAYNAGNSFASLLRESDMSKGTLLV